MQSRNTLIYTPYKTGSSTLYHKLYSGDKGLRVDNFCMETLDLQNIDYFLMKYHSIGFGIDEITNSFKALVGLEFYFDTIFTIVRNPIDLYKSAYFQDINFKDYPYYFGEKERILNADVDTLINHFKSFSWPDYMYLNIYYCLEAIGKYVNTNLLDYPFDRNKKYQIIKGKNDDGQTVQICILRLDILNDEPCLLSAIQELYSDSDFIDRFMKKENINISEDKWYGKKYKEFKEQIQEILISQEDQKIIDHFGLNYK